MLLNAKTMYAMTDSREPKEDRGPPAVAIGESSPTRRAHELPERERGENDPNGEPGRAQPRRVVRDERQDHRRSHHVHERNEHQDDELAHARDRYSSVGGSGPSSPLSSDRSAIALSRAS